MLTILLQGSVFGFLPKSIAQPFLDARKLFVLRNDFATLTLRLYASYLTDKANDTSVKSALELLGVHGADSFI
ncbi:hypothetical protein [Paenibacillus sp. YIM B09110]|uniref:hypothetical protein n=1 Tax=Paenibacillus sp. YIM B09110 TaxID=3126102 RepID=UPI00301E229A